MNETVFLMCHRTIDKLSLKINPVSSNWAFLSAIEENPSYLICCYPCNFVVSEKYEPRIIYPSGDHYELTREYVDDFNSALSICADHWANSR